MVLDQGGHFCISLLGGHLGGANRLAAKIARLTGGQEVITTATDSEGLPSIDMTAREKGLAIANIKAVKHVNSAIIAKKPIQVFDPGDRLGPDFNKTGGIDIIKIKDRREWIAGVPGVWVDWRHKEPGKGELLLHPKCLAAGIGCNCGTCAEEIMNLVKNTFKGRKISLNSLKAIATIDVKKNEAGLRETAESLNLPLVFFSAEKLERVDVPNPSDAPKKYVGAESVCEAAAILATENGKLIIPKIRAGNVTLAVALEV